MRNFVLTLLIIIFPALCYGETSTVLSSSSGDSSVASALTLSGIGLRIDQNGIEDEMAVQMPLYRGETVKTQSDSILEIRFTDGSILNLGPKSAIEIKQYDYDANMDFGRINIAVIRGVYRFTKGRIRAEKADDIKIDFPAGTISIHDAIVLGQVVDKRSVIILSGASISSTSRKITVKNRAGTHDYERNITEIGYGSVIEDENYAPTPVLKIPPTDIEWLRSQFIPKRVGPEEAEAEDAPEKEKKLVLQAIVHDGSEGSSSKFVVVGGKLYQEEDIVDNHKIIAISPNHVKCKNMSTGEVETLMVEANTQKKTPVAADEKINVESIFHDATNSTKSFAYINNHFYREGETVLNGQILEIRPTTVVILRSGAKTPETYSLAKAMAQKSTSTALPVLQSIAYDQDYQKRFATLNGKTYREGENVDNDLLFGIEPDAVWIKRPNAPKPVRIPLEKRRESTDEKPRLRVQVILFEPGKSQVAIGGVLYRVGDIVDGYEILEIRKNDVRLRKKGRLPWKTHILKV